MVVGSAQELPFIMRVKIAIGVVSGLVFLHHKQMIDEVWSLSTDYIWIDKVNLSIGVVSVNVNLITITLVLPHHTNVIFSVIKPKLSPPTS